MIHVLARARVHDLDAYLSFFETRGAYARGKHGSRGARVFRDRDDPARVAVLIAWDTVEAFEAYRADPDARAALEASGFRDATYEVLEEAGAYPR